MMVFRHMKVIQICVVVTARSEFSGGFQIREGGQDLCSDYYQVRSLWWFLDTCKNHTNLCNIHCPVRFLRCFGDT